MKMTTQNDQGAMIREMTEQLKWILVSRFRRPAWQENVKQANGRTEPVIFPLVTERAGFRGVVR
jgi:hypothetical protein